MSGLIIYTLKRCPYCDRLKILLQKENLSFKEHEISSEFKIRSRIITRDGHTPTPQVEFNGKIIFDYPTEESLVQEIKSWIEKFKG